MAGISSCGFSRDGYFVVEPLKKFVPVNFESVNAVTHLDDCYTEAGQNEQPRGVRCPNRYLVRNLPGIGAHPVNAYSSIRVRCKRGKFPLHHSLNNLLSRWQTQA